MGLLLLGAGCGCKELLFINKPKRGFGELPIPAPPHYANEDHWAALPWRADLADRVPRASGLADGQDSARADVFYIHPTTTYRIWQWNGPLDNKWLNFKTAQMSVLRQMTAFNGSCRVFAPRYRQAILYCYFEHSASADSAMELAYQDVLQAFEHYLAHWNHGRPFFIAGHSQGATHLVRLLNERIAGHPIQRQLVAAYAMGLTTASGWVTEVVPFCEHAGQTGCWVAWNTMAHTVRPDSPRMEWWQLEHVINPLSWRADTLAVPASQNPGSVAVIPGFRLKRKKLFGAQIRDCILTTQRRQRLGFPRLYRFDYHAVDINIYYLSVRQNVAHRLRQWQQQHPEAP